MSDLGRWRRHYSNDWLEASFRALTDSERVVVHYCRTGPQSTSVGLYRLSAALAVEDLGNVTSEQFEERFAVVREALGWKYDEATRVLWQPEWIERNGPQSANVVSAWKKLLENVPDCSIKLEAVEAICRYLKESPTIKNHQAYLEALGDLPRRLRASFRNSEVQPQVQAVSDQGAGIQRSGIQRSGNRKIAEKTNPTTALLTPDPQILKIAHETLRYGDPNGPIEALIDVFYSCAQHSGINVNGMKSADVIAYLNLARAESSSSAARA